MRDLSALYLAAFRELKPRTPPPAFHVKFHAFAYINSTIRRREAGIFVRISDLLELAPDSVHEALAQILLRKLYRRPIPEAYNARYRRFIARKEVSAKAVLLRGIRGRPPAAGPVGDHYNLDEIFAELNQRFFFGLLARPALGWSPTVARRNLGHYDPAHNAILISRVFDSPRVPRLALEYTLYHEMLHLKHPVRATGGRRCVHSPEFRAEERLFPGWRDAEAMLRGL